MDRIEVEVVSSDGDNLPIRKVSDSKKVPQSFTKVPRQKHGISALFPDINTQDKARLFEWHHSDTKHCESPYRDIEVH